MSPSLALALRFTVLLVAIYATAGCTAPDRDDPAVTALMAAYPMNACVVSGGKLGSMGQPVTHTYRQAGQPDRTVMFCCKGCIRKFEKAPAQYIAKLDAAETVRAGGK